MAQPQTRDEKAALSILLVASSLTILAGALVSPALPAMKERFADAANVDLLLTLVLTVPGFRSPSPRRLPASPPTRSAGCRCFSSD